MFKFSLLPVLAGAQLGPARVVVDESLFQGCVDAPEPLGLWGSNVSCADWAAQHDAVGHCNVQDLEVPPDCDGSCQAWFRDGNPLMDQCPDTCGYCGSAEALNMLEPAGMAKAEADHPGAIGHIIIEGEYFCLQGPIRHQAFMLGLLKSGSFGNLHSDNTVQLGPCSVSNFPNLQILAGVDGHEADIQDHCYPPSLMYHRTNWVEIEPFGNLPVGDLLDAMEVENVVADEWLEHSSWPAGGDDDMGVWPSLLCFCTENSQERRDDPNLNEDVCEEWSQEDRRASYVPDHGLSCVESHMRYANRALAVMRTSSLARLYTNTRLEGRTCSERGFEEAAEDHPCFPGARRSFASADGPDSLADAESTALEAYAAEHADVLGDHSPDAVRSCSCLAGSPMREGLTDNECDAPELQSPVLQHWPAASH